MMTKSQKIALVLLSFHYKRIKITLATDKDIQVLEYLKTKVYGKDKV